MKKLTTVFSLVLLSSLVAALSGCGKAADSEAASSDSEDGWVQMFDGTSLTGWKSNGETMGSFTVADGAIKTTNGRAHLFYIGEDGTASFQNFEFKAKVKHMPGANSGIYIHTEFQESGWPEKGHECQVNSASHKDKRKTGGLYGVADVLDEAPVGDDEWFDYYIRVEGKRILIRINGETTTDWTEPEDWNPETDLTINGMPHRKISSGTIALQAHDPDSNVYYKDLYVRPLP